MPPSVRDGDGEVERGVIVGADWLALRELQQGLDVVGALRVQEGNLRVHATTVVEVIREVDGIISCEPLREGEGA